MTIEMAAGSLHKLRVPKSTDIFLKANSTSGVDFLQKSWDQQGLQGKGGHSSPELGRGGHSSSVQGIKKGNKREQKGDKRRQKGDKADTVTNKKGDKTADKGRQKGDKADTMTNKKRDKKEDKRKQKGDKADTVAHKKENGDKGDTMTKKNRKRSYTGVVFTHFCDLWFSAFF